MKGDSRSGLRTVVLKLATNLRKYSSYLENQSNDTSENIKRFCHTPDSSAFEIVNDVKDYSFTLQSVIQFVDSIRKL